MAPQNTVDYYSLDLNGCRAVEMDEAVDTYRVAHSDVALPSQPLAHSSFAPCPALMDLLRVPVGAKAPSLKDEQAEASRPPRASNSRFAPGTSILHLVQPPKAIPQPQREDLSETDLLGGTAPSPIAKSSPKVFSKLGGLATSRWAADPTPTPSDGLQSSRWASPASTSDNVESSEAHKPRSTRKLRKTDRGRLDRASSKAAPQDSQSSKPSATGSPVQSDQHKNDGLASNCDNTGRGNLSQPLLELSTSQDASHSEPVLEVPAASAPTVDSQISNQEIATEQKSFKRGHKKRERQRENRRKSRESSSSVTTDETPSECSLLSEDSSHTTLSLGHGSHELKRPAFRKRSKSVHAVVFSSSGAVARCHACGFPYTSHDLGVNEKLGCIIEFENPSPDCHFCQEGKAHSYED
ncbi:hypothetical protein BT63DRAFT_450186 [Microthyrium microscopicum]|uniref:Uncharacterized protein n=1 Tax=Microthyrium microscopicum TaxID=703497 RepID=A0A6A6USV1_9PEZI|nr:hypothetical protein BT63DRAFT_450186 [Microthyrium microscopicum]